MYQVDVSLLMPGKNQFHALLPCIREIIDSFHSIVVELI